MVGEMSYDNQDIQDVEIARHLRLGEITCHCCGRGAMNVAWLTAWGRLRAVRNMPITMMSGFRCPAHNAELVESYGASVDSLHMAGIAGDVAAIDPWWFTDDALAVMVESGFRGIGRHREWSFVHMDVRSTPYFWTYEGKARHEDKDAMKIFEMRRLRHDG